MNQPKEQNNQQKNQEREKGRFEIVTSTGEVLDLTKNIVQKYLSPNAQITDDEFMYFFQLCKVQKLNPFLKEAYIIKYGNAPATIVTDYKVLQQIADRSGVFTGIEQGVVVLDENSEIIERKGQVVKPSETLIGGWAIVYRKDREKPFYVSVNLSEFEQKKKDGSLNNNWSTKPSFMIEKVAKAHAFRVAFPQEMQGVYIEDEMTLETDALRDNKDNIIIQNDVDIPNDATREEIIDIVEEKVNPKESENVKEVDLNAI